MKDISKSYRSLLAERQGRGFSEGEVEEILRQSLRQLVQLHKSAQVHNQITLDTIVRVNNLTVLLAPISKKRRTEAGVEEDLAALGKALVELLTAKPFQFNWEEYCTVSDQMIETLNQMVMKSAFRQVGSTQDILTVTGVPESTITSETQQQTVFKQGKSLLTWRLGIVITGSILLAGFIGLAIWRIYSPNSFSLVESTIFNQNQDNAKDKIELYPVEVSGKYGFIDKTGSMIIAPQFDAAHFFFDGLASVEIDNKWGFVDKTGKMVIMPQFEKDRIGLFYEGLAAVWIDKKHGFIDKQGNIAIAPQFDIAYPFSEGLALVKIDKKWGFIDKQGNIAITPQYEEAYAFYKGLAPVKMHGKWGFIDKQGNIVISPQFDFAYSPNYGQTSLSYGDLMPIVVGNKWGFIDKQGNIAITPQFDFAYPFYDGLAPVQISGKWGFINEQGNIAITPQFDESSPFFEELASVKLGGKWGFIDKQGNIVITPQFDKESSFLDGVAPVLVDQKRGLIDKTGKWIWNPHKSSYSSVLPPSVSTRSSSNSSVRVESQLTTPQTSNPISAPGQIQLASKQVIKTERVSFTAGSTGTTLRGNISGSEIKHYLLECAQGQQFFVQILQGSVSVRISNPKGQMIAAVTNGNTEWQGVLPINGDYIVTVSSPNNATYTVRIDVF